MLHPSVSNREGRESIQMALEETRSIWAGDNLDSLSGIAEGTVHLSYMDPPFASGRTYDASLSITRGNHFEAPAFEDRWQWDDFSERSLSSIREYTTNEFGDFLDGVVHLLGRTKLTAYMIWLAPRLFLVHRSLTASGSMYVHCDPKASHYIKIMMDAIFRGGMFLNEIVWRRTHAHSSSKRYGPSHDIILYYSKGTKYTWNPAYQAYDEKYLQKYYVHEDLHGKYQLITCTAPGDRTGTKAHYVWKGMLPPQGRHWAWKIDQMQRFEESGHLVYSSNGVPRLKRYVTDGSGVAVQDIWTDIQRLDAHSVERVGFETQKPIALLSRIISASSCEGDLVLDPFCGSGTTLVAAERLGRRWLGLDQSLTACSLSLGRTRAEAGTKSIRLKGFPSTTREALGLKKASPLEFGVWGLALTACLPDRKLTSDGLLVGSGNLGTKKGKHSLVGLIPLNGDIHRFPAVPRPLTRGTPILLGQEHEESNAAIGRWAASHFSCLPVIVPLSSVTSLQSSEHGIAPGLLNRVPSGERVN